MEALPRGRMASRHYDLEVRLNKPYSKEEVFGTISSVHGVGRVESWDLEPIAAYRPNGLDIVRTYPDGGHGSFMLRSAPPESVMLESPVMSGRWLRTDDADGVALNQLVTIFFPGVKVGDRVSLTNGDRGASFRVVGIVRQIMTPAAAYVTPQAFAEAMGLPSQATNAVRVVMDAHDAGTVDSLTGEIGAALEAKGIGVKLFSTEDPARGSERRPRLHLHLLAHRHGGGRAIGATSHKVSRNVIAEGILIGLMSWFIAVALSLLPSLAIDALIGGMFSRVPLTLIVSPAALLIWLLVVTLGSLAASGYPAWQASRLTVRETLAYV